MLSGRSSGILLVLVALSLLVGAIVVHRSDDVAVQPTRPDGAAADTTDLRARGVETAVEPLPTPPVSAPLPPPDAPFDVVAPDLLARAEAGDAGAACRLSLELLRCRLAGRIHGGAAARKRNRASRLVDSGDVGRAEWELAESERLAAVEHACEAIDPALIDRAPHFLRQAALAGDREALRQYVDGRNLFHHSDYGFLTTPEFDTWRSEAPRLLRRMLEAGDPQAAIWLAEGYAPGAAGPLQGLLRDDPERARAWLAVAKRLYGPMLGLPLSMPDAGAGPTPTHPEAAALHERWFGGRTHDLADRPVLDLLPNYDPNVRDIGTRCGAAP